MITKPGCVAPLYAHVKLGIIHSDEIVLTLTVGQMGLPHLPIPTPKTW